MTNLSELLSTVLVKNTANVIVDYLTDPPVLPFIDELMDKTQNIEWRNDECMYYSTYYISTYGYGIRRAISKIHYLNNRWKISSNYL
jgi:hypothetical protein